MSVKAGELAHYFRAVRALARASSCGCGCHAEEADDAKSDLEAIAFTTDDAALKLRCEAVLFSKPPVNELVREPFYDDVEHIRPRDYVPSFRSEHGTLVVGVGLYPSNLMLTCPHVL